MLQIITPTGDRPLAWALCQRWMAQQTYSGPVVWFVSDDGIEPQSMIFHRPGYELRSLRLAPKAGNTQARNLLALLDCVDRKWPVVVWEDDDYYAPNWLNTIALNLHHADLIGESPARYYNVALRIGLVLKNRHHASLCATVVQGLAIQTLISACQTKQKFIDIDLWKRHPYRYLFSGQQVIGIKGLPGRMGIGLGHQANFTGTLDLEGQLLTQWIGKDAVFYLRNESCDQPDYATALA